MTKKSIWSNIGFVALNFVIAGVVAVLIVVGTLFWLDKYTRNGQEVDVPDLMGASVEEAEIFAKQENMTVMVVDSIYDRSKQLGIIVEQTPIAGSKAKRDRTIYVVINTQQLRQIPLPDLRDASYRQAIETLKKLGIEVDPEFKYEPYAFKNLVINVEYNGEIIEPGTRLKDGSKVVLVVGMGQGSEYVEMPELLGKTLQQVKAILLEKRLTLGAVAYDVEVAEDKNTDHFVVIEQSEMANTEILEGSRIDIRLTADLSKAAETVTENEEDFF